MLEKNFESEEQRDKRSEEFRAVVSAVFNVESMEMKAVLNPKQAFHLARGSVYAYTFKSEVMKKLISYLLQYSVSVKGRGRNDLKTLLQAMMHQEKSDDDSMKHKLLGI